MISQLYSHESNHLIYRDLSGINDHVEVEEDILSSGELLRQPPVSTDETEHVLGAEQFPPGIKASEQR
jgi:hypothetical protein